MSKLVVAGKCALGNKLINWSHCCLCQNHGDYLIDPSKNPIKSQKIKGYQKLAEKLMQLTDLNYTIPSGHSLELFDEGCGIENTLINRKAVWHKDCYKSYTENLRFERILKNHIKQRGDENKAEKM